MKLTILRLKRKTKEEEAVKRIFLTNKTKNVRSFLEGKFSFPPVQVVTHIFRYYGGQEEEKIELKRGHCFIIILPPVRLRV